MFRGRIAEGSTGKPELPRVDTREPQRADGAIRNTPPTSCRKKSSMTEHGRLLYGCEEQWGSSEGETPHESSMAWGTVGRGIGVGGRESRAHGDEDPWRRPLACGKTGAKVPSERASCPR